jgi:putative phage-type endonuclease
MQIIKNINQGTDEWHELRLGKVTASRLSDVISKGRGNAPSKTRASYMLQLAAERLTGEKEDSFSNKYMEWGNECEPQARSMYEFDSGNEVEEVAFVIHSDSFGVSPDGLIGDNGILEIKCPKTTTQIERYLKGKFPTEYKAQVQGQLLATNREWCDFVSFDPRISGEAQYFCIRVERDEEYISELFGKINDFVNELDEMMEKLK